MSSEPPLPEKLGGTRDHDKKRPWVGLVGHRNNGWSYATWRKGSFSTAGNLGLAYTFSTQEAALAFAKSFPFGGKKSAKRLTVLSNPTSQRYRSPAQRAPAKDLAIPNPSGEVCTVCCVDQLNPPRKADLDGKRSQWRLGAHFTNFL